MIYSHIIEEMPLISVISQNWIKIVFRQEKCDSPKIVYQAKRKLFSGKLQQRTFQINKKLSASCVLLKFSFKILSFSLRILRKIQLKNLYFGLDDLNDLISA